MGQPTAGRSSVSTPAYGRAWRVAHRRHVRSTWSREDVAEQTFSSTSKPCIDVDARKITSGQRHQDICHAFAIPEVAMLRQRQREDPRCFCGAESSFSSGIKIKPRNANQSLSTYSNSTLSNLHTRSWLSRTAPRLDVLVSIQQMDGLMTAERPRFSCRIYPHAEERCQADMRRYKYSIPLKTRQLQIWPQIPRAPPLQLPLPQGRLLPA